MRRDLDLAVLLAVLLGALLLPSCATTGEPAQFRRVAPRDLAPAVTQSFLAGGDDLNQIRVEVATYGAVPSGGELQLELVDAAGEVVRTAALPGPSLQDNTTARLGFAPIADSGGRRFVARLRWTGTDPLAIWSTPADTYADGEASPGGGDLAFAIGHAGRARGAVAAMGRVASELGHRLVADPAFLIAWLAGLGALAAYGLRRGKREEGGGDDDVDGPAGVAEDPGAAG